MMMMVVVGNEKIRSSIMKTLLIVHLPLRL
jgi:hypothetical protein